MAKSKLYSYSIMPLDTAHIDEICEDIRFQYENGISSCPLFCMTLCPEGNPPADKATILCEKYKLFKNKLDAMGIPSGILVQATVGHGWILGEMFPYQPHVNFTDGKAVRSACPCDEGFKEYIYKAMVTVASADPDTVMIDDDFRTIWYKGEGCCCPLHMKRFNSLAGTNLTDRELWNIVNSDSDKKKEYTDIFIKTQRDSLVETAKVMRAAFDSVDPSLPVSYCCCGNNAEFAYEIASVLAGKSNPVVVRINNGNYTPAGARFFSRVFHRAATQIEKLRGKVDVFLAETDTCPQNRYSTGAMSLHTHYAGTILEGATGAKHWITRLITHEPESGKAYRRVLSKYSGFYERLAELAPTLKWRGCRIFIPDTPDFTYGRVKEEWDGWSYCFLERMGIPMYFSSKPGGAVCLEGDVDSRLSDSEIKELLSGAVVLASDTAERFCKRGFSEYLGVSVREWMGKQPVREIFKSGAHTKIQMGIKELVPISPETEIDSVVYNTVDYQSYEPLFPGVTVYKNSLGGTVIVFCGTPVSEFNLSDAFSYLTYSRKEQFVSLLSRTGEMPLYYTGDEEVYMKCADMADGRVFAFLVNIGLDPIENVNICCSFPVKSIKMLTPDGAEKELSYAQNGHSYAINTDLNTLQPLVLFIEKG